MRKKLIIYKQLPNIQSMEPRIDVINLSSTSFPELFRNGYFTSRLFSYSEAIGKVPYHQYIFRPFAFIIILSFLCRGEKWLEDGNGNRKSITVGSLLEYGFNFLRDFLKREPLLKQEIDKIQLLSSEIDKHTPKILNLAESPIYLRSDLVFGLQSGGSIGHIAGVLNHLQYFSGKPIFITTDKIPTISSEIELHCIVPDLDFWDFPGITELNFNRKLVVKALGVSNGRPVSFVYQRYSLNNYAGVEISRRLQVPFVLEFNGSEVWISRNWSKRQMGNEHIIQKIEDLNLKAADLIIANSEPMRDELVKKSVDPAKILINPNGVNPETYSPSIDGAAIRKKYNLEGKTVIGFIGTFGRWHGAEVLVEAFGMLLNTYHEYKYKAHLILIGDGITMPVVKEKILNNKIDPFCTLTGSIPQEDGPCFLAGCDILASPHVPNPDGTPFFGSPTKLFEYMAIGKGIVASDLNQIGEVLEHNRTAWLVKPGDPQSLMEGIKALVDDPLLRDRLGRAARKIVIEKYTWKEHTRRIIEKLAERSM